MDFNNSLNWFSPSSQPFPAAGDSLYVDVDSVGNYPILFSSPGVNFNSLGVGVPNPGGSYTGAGTMVHTGGTLLIDHEFQVGNGTTGSSLYQMSGDSVLYQTGYDDCNVGADGAAAAVAMNDDYLTSFTGSLNVGH